jgi:putative addiction module component (TIGR02574 family)
MQCYASNMNTKVNHLIDEALAFSVKDRAEPSGMLSENVADQDNPSLSPEWQKEIARRKADYKSGITKAVPWEEIKARFLAL